MLMVQYLKESFKKKRTKNSISSDSSSNSSNITSSSSSGSSVRRSGSRSRQTERAVGSRLHSRLNWMCVLPAFRCAFSACFFNAHVKNKRYAGPRPQDAGTHLLLLLHFFLSNHTLQLQCLQRAPGRRVTEKTQLFHTNCRSGRDLGSNPGHLRGRQLR
jgi:hypothetical protein